MRNEYSKRKRRVRSNPSEITQLENMSNKMNKLEQRVCSLKSDMKGQRESIMDMRVFQKQYKNLENKFRSQITRMAEDVQHHLDTAVTTYEQREEFINKAKIYKERCAQDLRKAALNENALQLVLDESEKLEEFENLQKQKRFDSRIATTGELIDQGLTGLESELKRNKHLNSAILHSSGKEDAEVVEDHYKLTDEHSKSMFSYLEQLLKYIRHLQVTINELKDESGKTQNSLVTQERRLKWETAVEKKLAEELEQEVTSSESSVQEAREQLHFLLKKLQSLHNKMGFPQEAEEPEDAAGSDAAEKDAEEHEISESNAIDFKEGIEKDVLKLLMVIEYLRVKELTEDSEEEASTTSVLGDTADDELQEGVEVSEVEYVNAAVQPRVLKSTSGMDIFLELDDTDRFLDLDELKEKAGMAVTELEKEGRVESKE
ncbi:hypothetical protein JTE90_002816 [Oedothorax gibbosus]|uniref:ODAD1 central coiled coil region domain-containing protein n=1 Tax=Oedothorax gibbosus TaxID=931172 RepID=A0AAV6U6J6_9ARAC|nr:hypothetical protein JTE90_002816 [Oedothorax gibbosus]